MSSITPPGTDPKGPPQAPGSAPMTISGATPAAAAGTPPRAAPRATVVRFRISPERGAWRLAYDGFAAGRYPTREAALAAAEALARAGEDLAILPEIVVDPEPRSFRPRP